MSGTGAVGVVVLAGGQAKPEMAAATGQTNRALMPVAGVPMLDRVLAALEGADSVGDIAVVGSLPDSTRYLRVDDHGGFVDNLFAGLAALPESGSVPRPPSSVLPTPASERDNVIIATADLPFLTSEAVEDLVWRGLALQADIVYPVVSVADCYARFPGVRRTAVRTREGEFTGGNLVLARRSFLERQRRRLEQAYALRKSPLGLAKLLGPGILLRFGASRLVGPWALGITHLERAVSGLLGGDARCLISPYPELATDIDRPEDLLAAERLLRVEG